MTIVLTLLVAASAGSMFPRGQDAALTVDGKLDDPFWRMTPAQTLTPAEAGVPAGLGGEVRARVRGSYLCLAARLPEPGGKILARSIGRNPVWEKDASGSPEVEDRIQFRLKANGELSVTVNPWGAYRIESAGQELAAEGVLSAAEVTTEGWTVEVAVPLSLLKADRSVSVLAERIRSRRPLAPEFRWLSPARTLFLSGGPSGDVPEFRPPVLGNADPPLEIGRVPRLPDVKADWDDPAWQGVPAFELARNEPYPRAPRYPTRVRWVHDGHALALLFHLTEPEPVVARAGGRDSAVTSDDHVAIYLATSGSAFVEVAVNSVGAIRDSLGRGPHTMRLQSGWNADVQARADIRHGAWTAQVNLPLDQIAAALGESGVPLQWRVLLLRHRAARPGEAGESSALPVIGASTFTGPARYRGMVLSDAGPDRVKVPERAWEQPPREGLARELAMLDCNVWSPLYRRYHGVRTMVQRQQRRRARDAVWAERKAWEAVRSREDWERFRDARLNALRESAGQFPPERPPLDRRITAEHQGDRYRLQNLVYQSRPGFYVTANLYLPATPVVRMPAIVIVHSQHFPKTQGELHDMGQLWARTGCAVLILERPGYGERAETTPGYRQAYASRFTFTKQLFLVGESYSGWAAWDVIRSVDLLYQMPEIDRERIILLGSVAGGGEIAGVAAALDSRISAVVPFNYDQGHVRVHGDSPGQILRQFSPWLVAASVAPRKFVRAFEFGWEGAEEPDYPELWADGWLRSEKVWELYGARENLARSQGYGLIRLSNERASHCFSIGPQQREELYPILKRWFGIPVPEGRDLGILPDSELSAGSQREEARRQEGERRGPHADLLSIPPSVAAGLPRKKLHEIAFQMASRQLEAARARRRGLTAAERARQLRKELAAVLGDIEPAGQAGLSQSHWTRMLAGVTVEAISVMVEEGIDVPLLLLRPENRGRAPVVVAVAEGGKERFLANRTRDLEKLLRQGIAVCLADVRGTGETSPSPDRGDNSERQELAETEFDLGNSLLGARLKDLRIVLAYLRTRADLDRERIAVWGDSFAPPNPAALFLDEIEYEAGPRVQHMAEPTGAHLALLAALYEEDVRVVAARGGLSGYLSLLEDSFVNIPADAVVLGILKVGDIADIAAALAPRALLRVGLVTGRNVQALSAEQFPVRAGPGDVAGWLVERLH